jgi:hypothetical protein
MIATRTRSESGSASIASSRNDGRRSGPWFAHRSAEILDTDPSRVEPTMNLLRDLAITSLDLLDLTYRLESAFEVKIPRGPIQLLVRQGLDEPIHPDGRLGPRALERLRIVMPEADEESIVSGLKIHQISDLYTAETFVRLVAMALSTTLIASL